MPVAVALPRQLTTDSMYELLTAAIDGQQAPRDSAIVFDFSQLSFTDPNGMTILSNLLEWLAKRKVETTFVSLDPSRSAIHYMDDCGFFLLYRGQALRPDAAPRPTTMPFKRILTEASHSWLDLTAFPWLADKLHVPASSLAEFKTCVREVFNNIRDHSLEDIGCIHMQLYPNKKTVQISVSDFGVGIPVEMRKRYSVRNDAAAIALAVQEGVSSKPGGQNRGAGLSYLIDNVVKRNGGTVRIYSNTGQLSCQLEGKEIRQRQRARLGYYPGTLISIELRTDRIEPIEEEREALEW